MNNLDQIKPQEDNKNTNILALLFKMLFHWHYFAISIIVAVLLAFLFNKYSVPLYETKATVLIKTDNSQSNLFQNLKFLNTNSQDVQNEIGIIQSYDLANRAVKKLGFYVTYLSGGKFRDEELYKTSPFDVVIDTSVNQIVSNIPFSIKILSSDKYLITLPETEETSVFKYCDGKILPDKVDVPKIEKTLNFGEPFTTKFFSFKLFLNKNYKAEKNNGERYQFMINDLDQITKQFQSFEVKPLNKDATIIEVKIKNKIEKKGIDFLNTLLDVYIQANLDEKNQISINTMNFIDAQLTGISDSLDLAENALEKFRSTNKIMDISFSSQALFNSITDLDKDKSMAYLQSQYYQYLLNYLKTDRDVKDIVAPSTMGIEDKVLVDLVGQLLKLSSDKNQLSINSTSKNPYLIAIEQQIDDVKKALYETAKNLNNYADMQMKEISKRISAVQAQVDKLPENERNLVNIKRKYTINDQIFTFLLTKRAESAITKASNVPNNKIINYARDAEMVYPKKSLNYLIGIILGFLIPFLYIYTRDMMNDKIVERNDVENLTKAQILGHVIHTDKETKVVVSDSPKSSISESFRSIRTNIQYATKNSEKNLILITSTMVGEGNKPKRFPGAKFSEPLYPRFISTRYLSL